MIEVSNLSKVYEDKTGYKISLLENVSFNIEEKKLTAILAPVGAGKSSLLKIISGLENQTDGEIKKDDSTKIVFIPSDPSSYPWMNVKENMLFANSGMEENKLEEIIEAVGLAGYEDHFPDNKSMGFRFRISLGRALCVNPALIVIDEPFNKFDRVTKKEIYELLHQVKHNSGVAVLLGTTNVSEAIYLSDKIYLLKKNPGEIIGELEVNLGAERNEELFVSEQFTGYREKIENIFKQNNSQKLFNLTI
ncbi:MAG: ATP-binding cassette domain-containing protein [Ignavibacteria bacterium]|jgi:ABC-type nitrate/sulfonate/bicarbonate transport system ATPase subunit